MSLKLHRFEPVRFLREDRDTATSHTFFLDRDTNPYNGNNVRTLRRFTMTGATSVTAARISIVTDGIAPGTYFIGGQVSDSQGHLRTAYTGQVTFVSVGSSSKFSQVPIAAPPERSTSGLRDHAIDLVTI